MFWKLLGKKFAEVPWEQNPLLRVLLQLFSLF